MDLIVTTLSDTHTLRVQPHDTVGSLKHLIHQSLGFPPHKQRLVSNNGQKTDLSDDSLPLSSYGLRPGSRVSLLVTEPDTVQVFLKTDKGQVHTYDIRADETVDGFKRRVESRESVPVSQQRLVYQGREMSGGKLSDYKVQALSTIDLCLRLRGG